LSLKFVIVAETLAFPVMAGIDLMLLPVIVPLYCTLPLSLPWSKLCFWNQ